MPKVPGISGTKRKQLLHHYGSHSTKYVCFAIQCCLNEVHEILPHCLALFLFCDLAGMDIE